MKKLLRIMTSLYTTVFAIALTMVLAFAGSLTLPRHLAFFSGIDDTPIFTWLGAADRPVATWWIYALVVAVGLLAACTLICSLDTLVRGLMARRKLLPLLSPQVVHVGVLLVLLGYLLSSAFGTRTDMLFVKGEARQVSPNGAIFLVDVSARTDEAGYFTDWRATLRWQGEGVDSGAVVLRPARPLRMAGYGLFIRSITMGGERPSALIRVTRDPGVYWALMGGVLLLFGSVGVLWLRLGRGRE